MAAHEETDVDVTATSTRHGEAPVEDDRSDLGHNNTSGVLVKTHSDTLWSCGHSRTLFTMSPIHLRVRELRLAQKMSIRALASAADVSPGTIVDIESGETKRVVFAVLEKLADALGVNAATLIVHTSRSRRKDA